VVVASRFIPSTDADLDLAPDDDDPHAILPLFDHAASKPPRSGRVAASFKVDAANVQRWMRSDKG
jgi:hypothetical protein